MKQDKINLLNTLPVEVQNEVKETLKAWSGCYVNRHEETGEYRVEVGIALTAGRNNWKCVADFENTDIYTKEECDKYASEVWGKCDMSAW